MQVQMTAKQGWLEIDGIIGTDYVPLDHSLLDVRNVTAAVKDGNISRAFQLIRDYTENRNAWTIRIIQGYGIRSSMPGYLDCTPWAVYTNKREAETAYRAEVNSNRHDSFGL